MTPRTHLLTAALATCLLSGCASTFKVTKYDPTQGLEGEGAVYFLPKTLMELRFGLELTAAPGSSCAREVDDCQSAVEPDGLRLVDTELVALIVPDDHAGFVLESQGTFVTETDFTASFNNVGELLATNSTVSDKTFETAAWGIETFGKLFASTVMAGSSDLKAIQQLATRRDHLLKAMRLLNQEVSESLDGGDINAVIDASPTFAELMGELELVESQLKTVTVMPVACAFDPAEAGLAAGEDGGARVFTIDPNIAASCPGYAYLQTWLRKSGLASVPPLPTLKVRLVPQASVERQRSADDQWLALKRKAGNNTDNWVPGLVYRVPAWFEVSVLSSLGPLLHDTLPVPQLGQLAALTIDQSALRKDRTFEVTLYEGLGSLQEVHYALSPMDLESANQVVDAVLNMKTRQAEVQVQQLEAQTAQIQAEMDYLQAQQELLELKESLANPEGEQGDDPDAGE